MVLFQLLVRLFRLPFDLVFLTVDLLRLLLHRAAGALWELAGHDRPPFGPCSHGMIAEVDGVQLSRCPLSAKYGNPALVRLLCAGATMTERAPRIRLCGTDAVLQTSFPRLLGVALLLLVFWGAVLGAVGYAAVRRYGNPFSSKQEAVEAGRPAPGAGVLTPTERAEQAREWARKGEEALAAGDPAGAREALRKAVDLDPSNGAAFAALGKACARLELFAEAGRAFDAALRLNPRDLETLLEASDLARDTGNLERALRLASDAVAVDDRSARACLALARAQRLSRAFEQAAATAARLRELAPADAQAACECAAIALGQGKLDDAEREFRRSIELDPAYLDARIGLAQVLAQRGDRAAARDHLTALAAQYPDSPVPRTELAELHLRDGRAREAVRLYGEVSAAFPKRFLIRARHAELLGLQGRTEEAYQALQSLLKDNPGDPTAHLVLADLFLRRGFSSLADEHVTQALAQRPGDAQAYRLRARIALAQGNVDAAIRVLRVLLEHLPQDADLHARLAQCLEQKGDLEEAEKEIDRAVRLRPEMAGLYIQRAQLMARGKRLADAEKAYRMAIEREPGNPAVLNNLALVLLDAGRPPAEARALAQQARELAPNLPQIADTLAWCYFREGNPAAAEPLSAEAARLLDEVPTVRFHRGEILAALGRQTEAAAELRAALDAGLSGPDAERAAATLKTLKTQ